MGVPEWLDVLGLSDVELIGPPTPIYAQLLIFRISGLAELTTMVQHKWQAVSQQVHKTDMYCFVAGKLNMRGFAYQQSYATGGLSLFPNLTETADVDDLYSDSAQISFVASSSVLAFTCIAQG